MQPLNCPATAVAVRERGTEWYPKIISFVYRIPPTLAAAVEMWVAVPGCGLSSETQLVKRDNNGQIFVPSGDSEALKDIVERKMPENFVVLTVGQGCAGWFVLRQFRVSATNTGRFLIPDGELVNRCYYLGKCRDTDDLF
jgi:hypothetical protein